MKGVHVGTRRVGLAIAGVVVLSSLVVLAPTAVTSQTGYHISSSSTVPLPERTENLQGNSFTVDSTIRVDPGDHVTVDVSAPSEVYRVYVYNSDEQIVDSRRGNGSGTFTFDLAGYQPGSYAITANSRESGVNEALQPLLIRGYRTSVSAPAVTEETESYEVSVSATRTAATSSPYAVKGVVADESEVLTVEASESGGEYLAVVEAGQLEPGEYTVFGVVQGRNESFGHNEVVGLSDGASLTVEAGTETQSSGQTGSSSGGGESGTESAGDRTQTESQTSPATTVTEPPTRTQESRTASPTERQSTASRADAGSVDSTTDESVITPDDGTGTGQPTTDGAASPGFGVFGAAVVVVLYGWVRLRTR